MTENVTITEADEEGSDEIYVMFYICPLCQDDMIIRGFNYCPNCGSKLLWNIEKEM